jgi:murein DD-endopeptidase MepM/ murein hydrolase activator NlpD
MALKKNRVHPFGKLRPRISAKAHYSNGAAHWAYDYATAMGTKLYAPRDGTIGLVRDGEPDGLGSKPGRPGNLVVLQWTTKAGEQRALFFNHLQRGSVKVKTGQKVKAGQVLGKTGNSGNSSGPHCHVAGLRYWPTWGNLYGYMMAPSQRIYPPNQVWRA